MILRFYAREGHVVRPPGPRSVGMTLGAIGRGRVKGAKGYEMPASELPAEYDSADPFAKAIHRLFRQTPHNPPLWPADEQTAAFCGVPYVPLKRRADGEYEPAIDTNPKKPKNSDRKAGDA